MNRMLVAFGAVAICGAAVADVESANIVGYSTSGVQTAGKFTTFMVPFNNVANEDLGTKLSEITVAPLRSKTTGAASDQAWIWTGTGWDMFFKNTSGTWRRTTANVAFDTAYPDGLSQGQAIYFKAHAQETAEKAVTVSGGVELDDETEIDLATGGRFAFVGNPYPTAMKLSDTKQVEVTNLRSKTTGAASDQVWIWTGTGWDMFFKNASGTWRRTTANVTFDTAYPDGLPTGAGVYFKSHAQETAKKTIVFKKTF